MQLTPDDLQRLRTKEVANAIRKVQGGKTLTSSERALLGQASIGAEPTATSGFAANWEELARLLGVSRRAIQDWRGRLDLKDKLPLPRADGRHDVAAWSACLIEHGLARADESVDPDDLPPERRTVRDWKEYREQLMCSKLEREIAREDEKLLVAAELEVAVGQLLAGIGTALNHLPGSAARFVVGLRDVHAVQVKLQSETDSILQRLHAAAYLEDCIAEVAAELSLDEAVQTAAREILRRIGRRALAAAQNDGVIEARVEPAPAPVAAPRAAPRKVRKAPKSRRGRKPRTASSRARSAAPVRAGKGRTRRKK